MELYLKQIVATTKNLSVRILKAAVFKPLHQETMILFYQKKHRNG